MGPVWGIVFIVICIIVSQPGASNCCQHFLCLFLFPLALSGSETPDEGHTDCMTIGLCGSLAAIPLGTNICGASNGLIAVITWQMQQWGVAEGVKCYCIVE